MVKVKYIGDMKTCSISTFYNFYDNWGSGEIRDICEKDAEKIVNDSPDFILIDKIKVIEEKKVKVENHYEDINKDGIVDEKDYSLAAKILASKKKKDYN